MLSLSPAAWVRASFHHVFLCEKIPLAESELHSIRAFTGEEQAVLRSLPVLHCFPISLPVPARTTVFLLLGLFLLVDKACLFKAISWWNPVSEPRFPHHTALLYSQALGVLSLQPPCGLWSFLQLLSLEHHTNGMQNVLSVSHLLNA